MRRECPATRWPLLGALGTIAGAGTLAVLHGRTVVGTADDLVADAGQVAHTTAADEHDGVLLQVVALAGDVGRDLDAVDETHAGDLAQGGVGLLGRGGEDAGAHATLLGVVLECRVLGLGRNGLATLTDELVNGRQSVSPSYLSFACICKGGAAPPP